MSDEAVEANVKALIRGLEDELRCLESMKAGPDGLRKAFAVDRMHRNTSTCVSDFIVVDLED